MASLKVDETASLSAEAYEGETKLSGGSFTYKSSNTDALTVDSDGKLTAKATASEVVITITYENKENSSKTYSGSKEIKLAVNEKDKATLTSVKVEPTETMVKAGDSTTLKATAEFNDGSTVTDGSKFTWSSEDESLATVDGEGKVTGVKYGTVRILVKYKDSSGNETSSACTVKVEQDPEKDTTTLLKDKNGNQVYIINEDGQYVEAKYADYFTEDEFYILKETETEVKYTGWQTIDGNTYYFDENGNKVTGEQVIQGVTYKFDSNGALIVEKGAILGIDVSKWNGTINWTSVKNSGVKFVIIRCGYRGSATGVLVEDSAFKKNVQGAQAVGLKVGVYFYTQAINEVEAVEEASMALELLQGISLSYPVFIDTEYTTSRTGRADKIDKATRTAICRAFCETIRSGGYVPGIYASKDWYINNLNYGSLSGYCIWLAQYASATTFTQHYDIWQYSEKGSVDGIKGTVDMNYSYMGY